MCLVSTFSGAADLHHEPRAAQVRVLDPDLPPTSVTTADRWPSEAGAFVGTFRRKKWIEDAAADLPGNARTRVVHRQRTHPHAPGSGAHDPGFRPHHVLRVVTRCSHLCSPDQAQTRRCGLVERVRNSTLPYAARLADLATSCTVVIFTPRRGGVGAPGEAQQAAHDARGTSTSRVMVAAVVLVSGSLLRGRAARPPSGSPRADCSPRAPRPGDLAT